MRAEKKSGKLPKSIGFRPKKGDEGLDEMIEEAAEAASVSRSVIMREGLMIGIPIAVERILAQRAAQGEEARAKIAALQAAMGGSALNRSFRKKTPSSS